MVTLKITNHATGNTTTEEMSQQDYEAFFNLNDRDYLAMGRTVYWGARIDGVPTKFSAVKAD